MNLQQGGGGYTRSARYHYMSINESFIASAAYKIRPVSAHFCVATYPMLVRLFISGCGEALNLYFIHINYMNIRYAVLEYVPLKIILKM